LRACWRSAEKKGPWHMAWPSCALVPSSPGRKASSLPRLQQAPHSMQQHSLKKPFLPCMLMPVLSINYIPLGFISVSRISSSSRLTRPFPAALDASCIDQVVTEPSCSSQVWGKAFFHVPFVQQTHHQPAPHPLSKPAQPAHSCPSLPPRSPRA
jgi:hypothetical protein